MDQARDKRIMSLVHACMGMTPRQREAFLTIECNGDDELRSAVAEILDEDAGATGVRTMPPHLTAALPEYYRLIELIGSGGMADVFLAEDTRLHRRVAIKFLNDVFRSDPERMLRFKQEARSASALNHPNIITIHDIGEADGVQYIVSEYVDGETLAARMTRGRLQLAEAIDIAVQIASALDTSHHAGIVHRDLKPENIMLRRDGGLKVVDFGLAKGSAILGHHRETLEVVTTSPGMILGTPRYMSPEQTRGLPLDGRSDIFSFGIILFEMVTGRTPFPGRTAADTIAAILSKDPREITDLLDDPPAKLVDIVHRCLNKDREERYRSMAAIVSDLQDLRWAIVTRSNAPVQTTTLKRRGNPLRWFVGGVVILMLAALGWWAFQGRGTATPISARALRNVPITSWSSVSPEAGAAASFSPDTKMVAFASTKTGASEIWSKPVSGGEPIQVTRNGFYNQYPVWSPDGQEIAFFSNRGNENGIWRVSFTGGQETQLTKGAGFPRPIRWTKDGRLFFVEGNEVHELTLASGERKQLTDLKSANLLPRGIAVAADGISYAVSVKDGGGWKVKTGKFGSNLLADVAVSKDQVDDIVFDRDSVSVYYAGGLDGTQQIFRSGSTADAPLQVSSGNTDFSLQDVSADGDKLLYSSIAETSDLWLINTSEGKATVVANDVPLEYWADISPDGKSVAYQSVLQADRPFSGSVMVKKADQAATTISADGFAPVWSPDAEWIAFFRRINSAISIWKARPSGGEMTQLTEGNAVPPVYSNPPYLKSGVGSISWSPDGSEVAYTAKQGDGMALMLAAADGSGSKALLSSENTKEGFCCAEWSLDGRTIIASSNAPGPQGKGRVYRIWSVSSDGTARRVIYEANSEIRCLGLMSRGEILFAQKVDASDSTQTPPASLWLVPFAGGAPHKLADMSGAYFDNITSTHDGLVTAYVVRSKEGSQVLLINSSGGPPKAVFTENDPKVLISSLAWSNDGKSIVLGKQTRTNVLSMLTN